MQPMMVAVWQMCHVGGDEAGQNSHSSNVNFYFKKFVEGEFE